MFFVTPRTIQQIVSPTRINISQIIDGGILVELLQEICSFKVIESDQCANIFCDSLDFRRIQHLKYHQLLSKTIPYTNKNLMLITYL